ncbi:hypothetical protein ACFW9L_09905 [Streptomyces sp. NPDC059517]|uniref:hypothetical protein n=1 Tax=Streptomyces sp. NPDC059517 TaxID=3346855 RepID=UPI0036BAFD9C
MLRGKARSNWPRLHQRIGTLTSTLSQDLQSVTSTPAVPSAVRAVIRKRVFAAVSANQVGAIVYFTAMTALICTMVFVVTRLPPGEAPLWLPYVFVALYSAPFAWRVWVTYFARGNLRCLRQFAPVTFAVRAIRCCAVLVTAPPAARIAHVDAVSRALRSSERSLLRGPSRFGSAPRSSPRRKQLKLHARLVVAALRQAELRLDTDPVQGAKELARLLVSVMDNYASGRLGALLPEQDLKDLEPVADRTALRETLHLVCALLVIGAVGWAGTWYGAKVGVDSPWSLIPAAIAAVLVFPRLRKTGPDLLMSYLGP